MTYRPEAILYHFPCSDGGASAALLHDFYADESITWIKGTYSNKNLLDDVVAAATGKHLMMVDFTVKGDELRHLMSVCASITILDHHDTAFRVIGAMDGVVIKEPTPENNFNVNDFVADGLTVFMTMDHSGVGLTYKFLYGDNPPEPVQMVEAIDLGREGDDRRRDFKWFTRSIEPSVEGTTVAAFGEFLLQRKVPEQALSDGRAIKRFTDMSVAQYADNAQLVEVGQDETYTKVPVAFASYAFASDVANRLINAPLNGVEYNMACCIYFDGNGMGLSLRSKNGVECNVVAEAFGGGGHKQAAGVNIAWPEIEDFVRAIIHRETVA